MNLFVRLADGCGGSNNLGTHTNTFVIPSTQAIDCGFIQTNQRAKWPADQMQFVLYDEVRRAEWIGCFRFDGGKFLRVAFDGGMAIGIFQLRGAPAVTWTVT